MRGDRLTGVSGRGGLYSAEPRPQPSEQMVPTAVAQLWKSQAFRAAALFGGLVLALWAIWEAAVRLHVVSQLVPAPSEVAASAVELLKNPFYDLGVNDAGIGLHLLSSLRRVMVGFALAVACAVPAGFWIGMSPVIAKAVDPFVQVLRPVSPLAWLPIGLAVLKDADRTAIFVIFISSVWPVLLNTIFGVRNIPSIYLDVSRTLEAGRWTTIRKVIWPAALPSILTGMRVSMGIAWLVIIAAEMMIGGRGIGYFIWNEWNNLNLANMFVCILLIGSVGMVLDRLFAYLERRVRYERS
ncbi:MAG: nitrate ABC transporter permease [Alicyclobacillaceae bacterium]|nr:nitrate ABC transporter permease [Alicyclobacillaceae bacterium]